MSIPCIFEFFAYGFFKFNSIKNIKDIFFDLVFSWISNLSIEPFSSSVVLLNPFYPDVTITLNIFLFFPFTVKNHTFMIFTILNIGNKN